LQGLVCLLPAGALITLDATYLNPSDSTQIAFSIFQLRISCFASMGHSILGDGAGPVDKIILGGAENQEDAHESAADFMMGRVATGGY